MLTLEFAKEVIRAKVEEYGPTHHVKDRYAENGKPHCIVGHVLAEYGVPILELERIEEIDARHLLVGGEVYDEGRFIYKPGLNIDIDPSALILMARVQEYQDSQNTWQGVLKMLP